MKIDKIVINGIIYYTSRYYAKKSREYNKENNIVVKLKNDLYRIIDKKEFGGFLYEKDVKH